MKEIEFESDVNSMGINPQDDSLWVALDWYKGILKFDGKDWTLFFENTARVQDIAFGTNGVVWITTNEGLFSYDGDLLKSFPLDLNCGESMCVSASMVVDSDESIWFAMHTKGLFHHTSGQWDIYENDLFLTGRYPIGNMCFTPDGKLWMGKWSNKSVFLLYFEKNKWHIPRILGDDRLFNRGCKISCVNGLS